MLTRHDRRSKALAGLCDRSYRQCWCGCLIRAICQKPICHFQGWGHCCISPASTFKAATNYRSRDLSYTATVSAAGGNRVGWCGRYSLHFCTHAWEFYSKTFHQGCLRLIGVPEKAEGSNPGNFFEQWLARVFRKENLSPLLAVEKVQSAPTRMPPPGAPPPSVLVRMLHFKDWDTILRIATDVPDLRIDHNRISICPDFSVKVQQHCMQFIAFKSRCHLIHDASLDRFVPPHNSSHVHTRTQLSLFLDEMGWIDLWRFHNPNLLEYTCFTPGRNSLLRIEYICGNSLVCSSLTSVSHRPRVASDH